eukprot:scaffold2191_cov254-Pinguiococcus_pyrenoidosus.AAC.21
MRLAHVGDPVVGLLLLLSYSVGYCTPLVTIGLASGKSSRNASTKVFESARGTRKERREGRLTKTEQSLGTALQKLSNPQGGLGVQWTTPFLGSLLVALGTYNTLGRIF